MFPGQDGLPPRLVNAESPAAHARTEAKKGTPLDPGLAPRRFEKRARLRGEPYITLVTVENSERSWAACESATTW